MVLDRFGRETDIRRLQEGTFRVRVKVAVSGQFFGWLTGLGTQVRLAGPENVVEEYRNYLKKYTIDMRKAVRGNDVPAAEWRKSWSFVLHPE